MAAGNRPLPSIDINWGLYGQANQIRARAGESYANHLYAGMSTMGRQIGVTTRAKADRRQRATLAREQISAVDRREHNRNVVTLADTQLKSIETEAKGLRETIAEGKTQGQDVSYEEGRLAELDGRSRTIRAKTTTYLNENLCGPEG